MFNQNKTHHQGLRASLSAALLLAATSASAITVDGNLSDLTAAVGAGSMLLNTYLNSDPMGSADSPTTESNNGFDIQNVYSLYDVGAFGGTLYLGIDVFGTVGDSRAVTDTTSLYEKSFNAANANRSVFDSNEAYRIVLFDGTSISDPVLLSYLVTGQDAGGDTGSYVTNPNSLVVTYAVSEFYNGVEFKITGLNALLSPFGDSNPANLLIFFGAESSDPVTLSQGAGDTHLMQTQVVPVPAAIWLFGSGLLGLVGASVRKRS